MLYRVFAALAAVLRSDIRLNIEQNLAFGSQLDDSVERHRLVAEAIVQGDAPAARRAMAAIINLAARFAEMDAEIESDLAEITTVGG